MNEQTIKHIALIPDGNRRWAKAQGKNPMEGHQYAVEHTLPELQNELVRLKIPYCTFWALSPENFVKRSKFEVDNLLRLIGFFVDARLAIMHEQNIKVEFIGNLEALPEGTKKHLQKARTKTEKNTGLVFTIAINYGGRDEMIRAIHAIENPSEITKDSFSQQLDTSFLPDPDLIIRTGGEKRTSGFLLWQSEYAEYDFVDTLFPDYTPAALNKSIEEFYTRKRRFGS